MSMYIDSADRRVVEELWSTGAFAGVTTNPTILARAGLGQHDVPTVYGWLTDLGVPTVYLQVLGLTTDEMRRSADELTALGPVTVKVPATPAGLAAARQLADDGVPVLLTAVYHPLQAVLARDLGLAGVAPYVGRMTDAGRDGVSAVIAMQRAIGSGPTRILAASLRSLDDVVTLAAAGVPDFTLGADLARQLVADELSVQAAAAFEADAARFAR